MTIQQCKCVLEIARCGSFSNAAKNLFLAQTSLSAAVKTLEQELGISIFSRSNRGVKLTQDGAEFVRYASQIVEQSEFITSRYGTHKQEKRLSVSAQHYDFVAEIFGELLYAHQDGELQFSLKESKTYDVITDVERAMSDVGVLVIKDSDRKLMERYLLEKKLVFVPILKTLPHVYVRNGHELTAYQTVTEEMLERFPYITYEQGEHNNSFFIEELAEETHRSKTVRITDRATLMNLLLVSDCYTIGTGLMTSRLNHGNIVSVPLKSEEAHDIGYIMKSDAKPSVLTQEFIARLIDFSETLCGEDIIERV